MQALFSIGDVVGSSESVGRDQDEKRRRRIAARSLASDETTGGDAFFAAACFAFGVDAFFAAAFVDAFFTAAFLTCSACAGRAAPARRPGGRVVSGRIDSPSGTARQRHGRGERRGGRLAAERACRERALVGERLPADRTADEWKPGFVAGLSSTFAPARQPRGDEMDAQWELMTVDEGYRLLPRLIRYIEDRRVDEKRFTGAIEVHPSPLGIIWGELDPVAVHFWERDAVAFQAVEAFEGGSARGEYGGPIPGVVRPLLPWETEKLAS